VPSELGVPARAVRLADGAARAQTAVETATKSEVKETIAEVESGEGASPDVRPIYTLSSCLHPYAKFFSRICSARYGHRNSCPGALGPGKH
jgi:hypothetical protein